MPEANGRRPQRSRLLLDLAHERYRFCKNQENDFIVVPAAGRRHARLLSTGDLRDELAAACYDRHGFIPSSNDIRDALRVLRGEQQYARVMTHLRVAQRGEHQLWVDLGDEDGRAILIDDEGWRVKQRPKPLFLRTHLTRPLPRPVPGGDIDVLRQIINISDDAWPLLLGWLVAAFIERMPHPILLLRGEKGTGKTSAMRHLVRFIDPTTAGAGMQPRSDRDWTTHAAASWVVALDNLSHIPPWFSDWLCTASTGAAAIRRSLYTDSTPHVVALRRVIALTAIDPGAVREDLADRLVAVELNRIVPTQRRPERAIEAEFEAIHPRALGALLDVVAAVWRELPGVHLDELERMADFTRVLAALDLVLGTSALDSFRQRHDELIVTSLDGDPFIVALRQFMENGYGDTRWSGTATELLSRIGPPPRGLTRWWPDHPVGLIKRINRHRDGLRRVGLEFDHGRDRGGPRRQLNVWLRDDYTPVETPIDVPDD